MKNIMTILKEQKEANRQFKKKDRQCRRILHPKTKADLLAGEKMSCAIGKAINIYQEFVKSTEPLTIPQHSENIELDTITSENIELDTITSKNIELDTTTEDSVIFDFDSAVLEKTDIIELEIIPFSISTADQSDLITDSPIPAQHELPADELNISEDIITSAPEIIQSFAPDIDESTLIANDSTLAQHEFPVAEDIPRDISLLLSILEQTKYVNLASRFLFSKYMRESEIELEESSSPNQAPINKSEHFPVVNFIKLNTTEPNPIPTSRNLNNPPIINFATLNTTEPSAISELHQFNKVDTAVNFAKLNTTDADQTLTLPDPNNLPVDNFTDLNTTELDLSLKSHNLSDFPVDNFIKLDPAHPNQTFRLQKLNNLRVVNFANSNTTDADQTFRTRNPSNPPTVNFTTLNTAKLDQTFTFHNPNKSRVVSPHFDPRQSRKYPTRPTLPLFKAHLLCYSELKFSKYFMFCTNPASNLKISNLVNKAYSYKNSSITQNILPIVVSPIIQTITRPSLTQELPRLKSTIEIIDNPYIARMSMMI